MVLLISVPCSKRLVFFVSTHNILQCSRFDEEAEEWEEVNLQGDGPLAVHPASQLSGSFVPDGGQIVVFEDPSGRLQGIQISGDGTGEWVSLTPIPAQLRQGAAHTVILDDDECCHMLYIHCDNHIHHLTSGFEGGEWNGMTHPLPFFSCRTASADMANDRRDPPRLRPRRG